jgi:hypothetical protein
MKTAITISCQNAQEENVYFVQRMLIVHSKMVDQSAKTPGVDSAPLIQIAVPNSVLQQGQPVSSAKIMESALLHRVHIAQLPTHALDVN